ncbi:MAG: hypothetical protein KF901_09355 [Myxococcales bacterium]|nr:hypothetical protein [Myxococcales bacterium]
MYRCQLCNTVQPARTPSTLVTVESRAAEYPSRPKAHRMRVSRKGKSFDDPGGAGFEIAKEAMACPRCADDFLRKQQEAEAAGYYGDEADA